MTDTAAAQLRRVLALIPLLADDENHSLETVASRAHTTVPQLMRDIESISERFKEPAGFVDGVTIFVEEHTVSVLASHFHRPMRLTMRELCALELGLMLLRRTRTPAEQKPIDSALVRLRDTVSNVPANDRHQGTRYADLANTASVAHLEILRKAVLEHRKVRLTYRSGGASESTIRVISPHSLAMAEQMWYVVSTNDAGDLRLFRVDRVEHIEVLDETFERNSELAAQLTASKQVFYSTTDERMTVRYSPRIARWLAEREGKPLDEDGALTLEHPLADESWAIRHVLQYGPDAEILSPARLRDQLLAKLALV
jgi:proteasome accessory factor C